MTKNDATYQVITANRLTDGLVVYLREVDGRLAWRADITGARMLEADEVEDYLARATKFVDDNQVIEPYAVEVINKYQPLTQREATRAHGPSISFGKDALKPGGPDFTI